MSNLGYCRVCSKDLSEFDVIDLPSGYHGVACPECGEDVYCPECGDLTYPHKPE